MGAPESQNLTPEASDKSAFESTRVLRDQKSNNLLNIDNKSNATNCNVSLAQAGGKNFGCLNPVDPHKAKLMEKGRNTPPLLFQCISDKKFCLKFVIY